MCATESVCPMQKIGIANGQLQKLILQAALLLGYTPANLESLVRDLGDNKPLSDSRAYMPLLWAHGKSNNRQGAERFLQSLQDQGALPASAHLAKCCTLLPLGIRWQNYEETDTTRRQIAIPGINLSADSNNTSSWDLFCMNINLISGGFTWTWPLVEGRGIESEEPLNAAIALYQHQVTSWFQRVNCLLGVRLHLHFFNAFFEILQDDWSLSTAQRQYYRLQDIGMVPDELTFSLLFQVTPPLFPLSLLCLSVISFVVCKKSFGCIPYVSETPMLWHWPILQVVFLSSCKISFKGWMNAQYVAGSASKSTSNVKEQESSEDWT